MKKLLIFILLTLIVLSCEPQCKTCSSDSSYACTSCYTSPLPNLYVKSCQAVESSTLFTALAIVMIIVHLVMLCLGYGVFRNVYENIQLLSLISWGYGSQNGIQRLSLLNFGQMVNNSFLSSYGAQFLMALTLISMFMIMVSAVDRLPHNTVATLIKRKRIIFPLRIQTLIFNMITLTALSQACTINQQQSSSIVEIIFSIVALIKQGVFLGIVFYITNFKNFQIDDHHYYVLVEKLSTCRWYARNNFLISLVMRAMCIVVFVVLFEKPQVAGILIVVCMGLYTVFSAATMRYVKWRYWGFNFIGNLLTCASLFCMYGCGIQPIGSDQWQQYRKAYYVLILTLCSLFLLMNFFQIIANSSQIFKQLKSIYNRFIICHKMDEAVELNKYDSDKYREKVTSFRKNLIYGKNINERDEIDDGNQTF